MSTSEQARQNVEQIFGDYNQYREGLTGRKQKSAEKHYNKLIDEERKKLEKIEKNKGKILPAKDLVLLANEANLKLDKCEVLPDHQIKFRNNGKKQQGRIVRQPHVLEIPNSVILSNFHFIIAFILSIFFPLKGFKFRTYTIRTEGEITHDPSLDHYDPDLKMKMEELLKVQGTMAKAEYGKNIARGMKDRLGLWEMFPYIAIVLIVLFFMLGYQVVPNM